MDTNTEKPYDLADIKAMCDDNVAFMEKLMVVFTETLKTEIGNVKRGAAMGDWATVGRAAHKIKPSLIHFKVTSLTEVIFGLEHYENNTAQQRQVMVHKLDMVINDILLNLKLEFPNIF